MTLLICKDGLIGDFSGIIPVMIHLAKEEELHVCINPEAAHLFRLIPKKYNIKLQNDSVTYERIIELDIHKAFEISEMHNYYMSQAHFAYLNLPVPKMPPKAEFEFELSDEPEYDFIIAPFSRSLPAEQCWPKMCWQQLVELMPGSSFCIIGHARDEKNLANGSNVFEMYDKPIVNIMNVLKKASKGLISVVSGPSHLAFHLGIKNYLLTNQPSAWGNNPEAVKISDHIPELKAEKLVEVLYNF